MKNLKLRIMQKMYQNLDEMIEAKFLMRDLLPMIGLWTSKDDIELIALINLKQNLNYEEF